MERFQFLVVLYWSVSLCWSSERIVSEIVNKKPAILPSSGTAATVKFSERLKPPKWHPNRSQQMAAEDLQKRTTLV